MLFINPIGGKKKGLKIWEKDVQPLMTIAGIETKMMVTEHAGHISDILLTADLSDLHVSCKRLTFAEFAQIKVQINLYIHVIYNLYLHICILHETSVHNLYKTLQ